MNTNIVSLTNSNKSGGPAPAPTQNLGKDDFMKLLLTQLSQQDPLNPQDSTAFVQQLSQFASLENLQNLGKKMDQLVTHNSISLIGKNVRVSGNQISGPSTVYYTLPQDASFMKLRLSDATGKTVKTINDIPKGAGVHAVDITDIPPGAYAFSVEGMSLDGVPMGGLPSIADEVKGVNFNSGSPMLIMGSGLQMNASDVVEIHEGTNPSSTATAVKP
jgi:flagellar basal-body rod modification protein FlgD